MFSFNRAEPQNRTILSTNSTGKGRGPAVSGAHIRPSSLRGQGHAAPERWPVTLIWIAAYVMLRNSSSLAEPPSRRPRS